MGEAEIKPGSVVKLISGGPRMTVAQITGPADNPHADCSWFDKDSAGGWCFEAARFAVAALVLSEGLE